MNDWIEIGLYAASNNNKGRGDLIYLEKHKVNSGRQTITITTPKKTTLGSVDPHYLLIVREGGDNTVEVASIL